MQYPKPEEVESADLYQLVSWNRFLPSPNKEQISVLNRILERIKEKGGINPQVSKSVGW